MTKEEDFFKENFPEYVTEKGECLSPYWDLFSAGVICATFESKVKIEQLEKENAELKTQIEKMKSDVMANIKWADKNCDNMWQKLVKMWNQWEIKEND